MWVYQNVAVSTVNEITLSNWFSAVTEDLHSARHTCVAAAHARGVGDGYEIPLELPGAKISVDFTTVKGEVVGYAIVLVLETPFGDETIRVYDAAHGFNEMHRCTRADGKQDGVVFSDGSLAEGMQAAIDAVKRGHVAIVEGWRGKHGGRGEEL